MTSLLVFFFLYVSKFATITQIKAIYSQPYFHMWISVSHPVGDIGIAVFAGKTVFACLRRLNAIIVTTIRVIVIYSVYEWTQKKPPKNWSRALLRETASSTLLQVVYKGRNKKH